MLLLAIEVWWFSWRFRANGIFPDRCECWALWQAKRTIHSLVKRYAVVSLTAGLWCIWKRSIHKAGSCLVSGHHTTADALSSILFSAWLLDTDNGASLWVLLLARMRQVTICMETKEAKNWQLDVKGMCKGYAVHLIRQGLMNCFWLLRKETAVKGDLSRGGDFLFHIKGSGERNLCGKVEMDGKSDWKFQISHLKVYIFVRSNLLSIC